MVYWNAEFTPGLSDQSHHLFIVVKTIGGLPVSSTLFCSLFTYHLEYHLRVAPVASRGCLQQFVLL